MEFTASITGVIIAVMVVRAVLTPAPITVVLIAIPFPTFWDIILAIITFAAHFSLLTNIGQYLLTFSSIGALHSPPFSLNSHSDTGHFKSDVLYLTTFS